MENPGRGLGDPPGKFAQVCVVRQADQFNLKNRHGLLDSGLIGPVSLAPQTGLLAACEPVRRSGCRVYRLASRAL